MRGSPLTTNARRSALRALDSEPDVILKMPFDSPAPFILTVGTSLIFAGMLIPSRLWALTAVGCLIVIAAILIWLWPERELGQTVEPAQ